MFLRCDSSPGGSFGGWGLVQIRRWCGATVIVGATTWGGLTACQSQARPTPSADNFSRVVYLVRQPTAREEVTPQLSPGMGALTELDRWVPGGRLELLEVASGVTTDLTAGFPEADLSSLDVSFDARRVVFSMKADAEDSYHLWLAILGDTGGAELHQLTFGPWNDHHPAWLAGGKVAFVTDQPTAPGPPPADEYGRATRVTQLGVLSSTEGSAERRLCGHSMSHALYPFALADGRVGFSRWEHFENINHVTLFAVSPDCSSLTTWASQQAGKPANALVQARQLPDPHRLLLVATARTGTFQAGSLSIATVSETEPTTYELLTPAIPRDESSSPRGRYQGPTPVPEGRILAAWAPGTVDDAALRALNPPDFGIYLFAPDTQVNQLLVNHPDSWELSPEPLLVRPEPPVLGDSNPTVPLDQPAVVGSLDVKDTSLTETISGAQFHETPIAEALAQARRVRIIQGYSAEATPGRPSFGLGMAEGATVLGEVPLTSGGAWRAQVPSRVPLRFQLLDEFGLGIRQETTWFQAAPGEVRPCGGCHEARSSTQLDPTSWAARAETVVNLAGGSNSPTEISWQAQVQPILTANCAPCHNAKRNGNPNSAQTYYTVQGRRLPRLDLSDGTDDKGIRPEWPPSYLSVFYPAALRMDSSPSPITVGELPPLWGIPGDARHSLLIEKLNIVSSTDPGRTAWPLGEAFSDPGVAGKRRTLHDQAVGQNLSSEDRAILIRAIDLGAPLISRAVKTPAAPAPSKGDGP